MFEVSINSDAGKGALAISRSLLTTALARLLRTSRETGLVEADGTLVEFVAVCILERLNRTLQFPFEFSLSPLSGTTAQQESGLMLKTAIQLSDEHGYMRLFLPGSVLEKLAHERRSLPRFTRTLLSWELLLSIGSVTLGASEIHQVEPDDTLIYTPACCLILPPEQGSAVTHRGWQMGRSEEEPFHFVVQTFHEWGLEMPQEEKLQEQKINTGEVDLSTLPVHIHVVLTRVEMSLNELEHSLPAASFNSIARPTARFN